MRKTIRYKTDKNGELIEISLNEFMMIYTFFHYFFEMHYYMNSIDEDHYEEQHYLLTDQGEILILYENTFTEEKNE